MGLYVEPAAQGAGLGTTLHDLASRRAARAGFPEAVLWVFEGNGHARGFFERRGWAPDGARGDGRRGARAALPEESRRDDDPPRRRRDVHAIAELQMRAWRAEHDGVVDEDAHADRRGPHRAVERRAAGGGVAGARTTPARSSGSSASPTARSASCTSTRRWPTATRIDDRLLEPRRGHHARRRPHDRAAVDVPSSNQHNRALYERHGWERDGVEEETLPGVTEIRYRRVL